MDRIQVLQALPGRRWRTALVALALATQPVISLSATQPTDSELAVAVVNTVFSTAAALDEVIVSGRLDRLSDVRKAMVAAEDRFWARYNEVNRNSDYDVTCRVEARTGTRLEKRYCEAGYLADAKRQDALNLFRGLEETNLRLQNESALISPRLADLRRRMLANVENDQLALGALVERFMLQDRYEQLRRKKFDGRVVVWD